MDRWKLRPPRKIPSRKCPGSEKLPWIPWGWVQDRYSPEAPEELDILIDAYQHIDLTLDIEKVRSKIPRRQEDDACRRCGQCCAQLLPEPVTDDMITHWMDAGNPAYIFHAPITEGPRAGRFHAGWHHNGVKLKMCPLLHCDPATGDKFCVVYHFGPGHRPPGCEGFRPNWPHCEVSQRPLVP